MRSISILFLIIVISGAQACWADAQTPAEGIPPREQGSAIQSAPPPGQAPIPAESEPPVDTPPEREAVSDAPAQTDNQDPEGPSNGPAASQTPAPSDDSANPQPDNGEPDAGLEAPVAEGDPLLVIDDEPVDEPEAIWALEPEFTRPLTPIQQGHNDSNPIWSPSGNMLAFERSIADQRKIVIALADGTIIKTIYFQTPEEEGAMEFFFPGITDTASYNASMSWSGNGSGLVFMSNGGSGNYDLYLLPDLMQSQPQRLTHHLEKDSHPHWSPQSNRLVFVSGSTGKADIFTMDLATRQSRQVTAGKKMYLYPQWSPDGQKIALIYGSNENHDIVVIEDPKAPDKSAKRLTTWTYDDLRPVWSPDGEKVAFYSNYNIQGDQKLWCIIVAAADGSDLTDGDALSAGIVAHQVVPDIEQGPAWMPDSRHIVYVKNDEQSFNPIYMVDIETRVPVAIQTHTKMNHDVTCSVDGTLAFRAQVEQWDHIYISKINPEMATIEEME